MNYIESPFNYSRRKTSTTAVGNTTIGSEAPIRIQSMANTNTNDTQASTEQCIRIIEAGADLVRFTTQGSREAENLGVISQQLKARNITAPIVADVHFNPAVADCAARLVDKVRINPGNYVDNIHTFKHIEYSNEEYQTELEKIRQRFVPFLNICKEHHTAIRIGVNHGSLSDRIMSRYGDTPQGMVESCMEFLRICRDEHFNDVVISIKSSNTLTMVHTMRLLVATMHEEGMAFPLHLGVTEAGDGEDGRIKSAVGIGTLLIDGIGDTLRVSLTEAPENEVPVARKLVNLLTERANEWHIDAPCAATYSPYEYNRRKTNSVMNIGGNKAPVVVCDCTNTPFTPTTTQADYLYVGKNPIDSNLAQIVDSDAYEAGDNRYALYSNIAEVNEKQTHRPFFVRMNLEELNTNAVQQLNTWSKCVLWLQWKSTATARAFFHTLETLGCNCPVVIAYSRNECDAEKYQLASGMFVGSLLIDGFGDGIALSNPQLQPQFVNNTAFALLQATRTRISKTEYVACPGCGRTMFDLQQTLARVKQATVHLKHLKIAVMGCIVNGTGEMADADYGYVGAGKGRISLYKAKECIEKNIPENEAIEHLEALIRANGDWIER